MYYTYVLFSKKDDKLYIGYSTNLKARIEKHNKGFVRATKYRLPMILIHYEASVSEEDAKRRELFLKGGKGHEELKILLQDSIRKVKQIEKNIGM